MRKGNKVLVFFNSIALYVACENEIEDAKSEGFYSDGYCTVAV